jgi:competence protein ComEA
VSNTASAATQEHAADEVAATPPVSPVAADSTSGGASAGNATLPEEGTNEEPQTFLGWTPTDRWFFGIVAAVILGSVAIHLFRLSGWGLTPIAIHRPEDRKYEFQLDINTATWVEWMQLEGLGETLARRVVEDRTANGPFQSIDDVARVNGIGPAKLRLIRPWLTFKPAPSK